MSSMFIPKADPTRLSDEPVARNQNEALAIANESMLTVAIVVKVDGGWKAFDNFAEYNTWLRQK